MSYAQARVHARDPDRASAGLGAAGAVDLAHPARVQGEHCVYVGTLALAIAAATFAHRLSTRSLFERVLTRGLMVGVWFVVMELEAAGPRDCATLMASGVWG